ncbi:hypothetical protein J6590_097653, partial [Homalodisca vitripennis]
MKNFAASNLELQGELDGRKTRPHHRPTRRSYRRLNSKIYQRSLFKNWLSLS